MSWFARSLVNSLKFDEDDSGEQNTNASNSDNPISHPEAKPKADDDHSNSQSQSPSESSTPRGVKEDLSEFTKTFTRQIWGVASFLAPPPESQISSPDPRQPSDPDEAVIAGIRSDFAEIGGKFRSGISKLSQNIPVSDLTKFASNFLQLGSEHDFKDQGLIGGVIGVTDEVVAFARDIAMHPETWLDFPVPEDEDFDQFDMSDAQQEHALAVERLAPRLAALRIELCPGYMSESCFWKIYFVLLHPRLSKHDAELLSTPQIVEVRKMLSHELNKRTNEKDDSDSSTSGNSFLRKPADSSNEQNLSVPSVVLAEPLAQKSSVDEEPSTKVDFETEKHPVQSIEIQIIDKSVIEEEPVDQLKNQHIQTGSSSKASYEKDEDDGDDWLKEESSEVVGIRGMNMPLGNDEDVSFSDLEEDDGEEATNYKKTTSGSDTSAKESRDWVQLSRSSTDSAKDVNSVEIRHVESGQVRAHNPESRESNDWLNVDDIDVM